jgi:hypothetical protein
MHVPQVEEYLINDNRPDSFAVWRFKFIPSVVFVGVLESFRCFALTVGEQTASLGNCRLRRRKSHLLVQCFANRTYIKGSGLTKPRIADVLAAAAVALASRFCM